MQPTTRSMTLGEFLKEAGQVLTELDATAAALAAAIVADVTTRRQLKEAEDQLAAAEAERVTAAVLTAKIENAGPLAGLAATSPAFKTAVDALTAHLRRGELAPLAARLQQARTAADDATIAREQFTVKFSALRSSAALRSSMLDAYHARKDRTA